MFELVLKSNFEVIENNLDALEAKVREVVNGQYAIVVTPDTVKEAKNTRAELNKGKKAIENAWKQRKSELEAPIKELNDRVKSIFSIIDEGMFKIDSQVSQFEAERRALAVALCEQYKDKECEAKGIDSSLVNVGGFANLTYITEKGGLSSAGKQAVDNLILKVSNELAIQRQRELEAQMELERIKQQAREELLQEQRAIKEEVQEVVQEPVKEVEEIPAPQVEAVRESQKSDEVIVDIKINLRFKTRGVYSKELEEQARKWAMNQINQNENFKQSLVSVEIKEGF